MRKFLGVILAALMLASCGGGGGSSGGSTFPTPVAGQWASAFGAVTTSNLGTSFSIPPSSAGVHYVYTAAPSNLSTAKTITLNYSLTGNATLTPSPCTTSPGCQDIPPASITLFMWESGDNLSCAGAYNYYRMFAPGSKVNLTYGLNQTITAPLNPANWQGCTPGAVPQVNWSQLMANPFAVGFTFSGQWFDGHGIYAATGSAQFTINSFTVK